MRRDMDLVRDILRLVADADEPVDLASESVGSHRPSEVAYHVTMMASHGLLDLGACQQVYGGEYALLTVDGLTWEGQDYLDAIEDQRVWAKTKEVVKKSVGTTTMAVIKETACLVATQMIKSALGV